MEKKFKTLQEDGNEEKHIKESFDTLLGLDLVKQLGDDIGRTLIRNSKGETKKIEEAMDDNIDERKRLVAEHRKKTRRKLLN